MPAELLIYTTKIAPRISYIISVFFESLINVPYKLVTDISEYRNYNGPKLNYSEKGIDDKEVFIHPSGLLTETGIHEQRYWLANGKE